TYYADRGVDLSLLGDDLVKGVEVSKTLQPNMDADALGGTVNLTLKTALPGFHYDVSGDGGYNKLRNSYANYKVAGSAGDRFADDQVGVLIQGNIEEKQLPSDQFSGSYATPQFVRYDSTTGQNIFNTSSSSATVTENNTKRHRYGVSAILDYTSDFVDVKLFNVYDQKNDSVIERDNTTGFSNNQFTDELYIRDVKTEQRTHSLQALFKLGGTELPVSLSYTKGESKSPGAQQFEFIETGAGTALSANALIYGQPSALIADMGVMTPSNALLWNIYRNNSDLTDQSYDAKADWKVPFKFWDDFSGKISAGGKYHDVSRASTNWRGYYNVQWGGSKGRRDSIVNRFAFLTGDNTNNAVGGLEARFFTDPDYTRTSVLGYPVGPSYDIDKMSWMENIAYQLWGSAYYLDGPNTYNQVYTDNENSLAGYVMGEFNIGPNLTIIPGARYQEEKTDISAYRIYVDYANQTGLAGIPPQLAEWKRDNPDWFPSVNFKYRVSENVQVLGAAYRSVSLPSYSDISPYVVYQANVPIAAGNPYLKPSTAWNFDLGTSLFSNDVGLFTVDLFYKEITDLIYSIQNYQPYLPFPLVGAPADIHGRLPGTEYFDTSWAVNNSGANLTASIPMNDPAKAYLRGIEFSWQTHLWYLPGVLSGIVLDLNLSLMSSNQEYPYFSQVQVGGTPRKPVFALVYATRSGSLQDQPKAIYNAIVGWDYKGFSSRVSVRYQEVTLTSVDTKYSLRDSYYDNVTLVDVNLKQKITDNIAVFADATNLNSHIDNYYLSHPAFNTIPAGQLPTSEQTYGLNTQVGLSFTY
ncbi:MAG TPA: TonB-dependent receptor, partial [Bacteroidota bacterium]|nr:TonB-dependent receptor [Bacteroidota bacterium]